MLGNALACSDASGHAMVCLCHHPRHLGHLIHPRIRKVVQDGCIPVVGEAEAKGIEGGRREGK